MEEEGDEEDVKKSKRSTPLTSKPQTVQVNAKKISEPADDNLEDADKSQDESEEEDSSSEEERTSPSNNTSSNASGESDVAQCLDGETVKSIAPSTTPQPGSTQVRQNTESEKETDIKSVVIKESSTSEKVSDTVPSHDTTTPDDQRCDLNVLKNTKSVSFPPETQLLGESEVSSRTEDDLSTPSRPSSHALPDKDKSLGNIPATRPGIELEPTKHRTKKKIYDGAEVELNAEIIFPVNVLKVTEEARKLPLQSESKEESCAPAKSNSDVLDEEESVTLPGDNNIEVASPVVLLENKIDDGALTRPSQSNNEHQSETSSNLESLVVSDETKNEQESPESSDKPKNEIESPVLPPRNNNGTSPNLPPKTNEESTAHEDKKGIGSPIISAMKKFVESPLNYLKSKKEPNVPSKPRKNKFNFRSRKRPQNEGASVQTLTKGDIGSPVLLPRNGEGPELPPRNGASDSPIVSSKIRTQFESPVLPPRNKIDPSSSNAGSPAIKHRANTLESPNLSARHFLSDDPKRFSSLQPKRNNNGRVRESSLPPLSTSTSDDGRKSPKIPPKTYMWEDLRRTKMRGGYPWTYLYKSSFDEAKWKEIMEHEYEYVDPRPELVRPEPVRPQTAPARETPSPELEQEPEQPKVQRRFIRIPDTDQVIIPLHGSSDEEHNPDRYEDPSLIGEEEVGLTPPVFDPSPPPTPGRRNRSPEPKLSEKLRTTAEQLGSKIRKISIPDKSKIRLPDKPKFISNIQQMKLPERPKFLSEKPKFLTEKPKFLSEKPKFLTEKPKFLTEKPKFLSKLPDKSKFKFPGRPTLNMPSLRLPKSRRTRPKRETSVKSEFGSDKNIFHTIKSRTYPRFLKRKERVKKTTSPPRQTKFDSESLPSTPQSKRNDKWTEVYKEKTYGEEKKAASYAGNGESFHERYSKRETKRASSSSIVDSDREQASSGSSTQRHRAGVIEEIDSDEFFVRKKGISREDVQVSRYLSTEIREAFRSPKNALESLDKEDFDDEEPQPPHRSKKPKEYPRKEFNTFPMRPSRSKKEKGTMEKPPRRFRSKAKQSSLPSLDRDREFDMDVEPVLLTKKEPPLPPKRRKSGAKDLTSEDHWTATNESNVVPDEGMALENEAKVEYDVPVAPVRKARSRGTSLADEDRTSRGAESIKSDMQIEDDLNDDFRMEDDHREKDTNESTEKKRSFLVGETDITAERSMIMESPAYSNVTKPPRPPPPQKEDQGKFATHRIKSKLLAHKQQLQTWKNQGVNFFFTYPRRAIKNFNRVPRRPVRNYSTIGGPTRPPRRHKVFREPVYVDADVEPADSIPFMDEEGSLKASKSEEFIGVMKGRPLPPPPRPPQPNAENETGSTDRKASLTNDDVNILNNLVSKEVTGDTLSISVSSEASGKLEEVHERMQGRPLPPPPRKKRGSTSRDRKRVSTSEDLNDLNDPDSKTEEMSSDVRISSDTTDATTVISVQTSEPKKIENKIVKTEPPTRPSRQDNSLRRTTAEISQQTSLEVCEITVSVQTDPLPEGAIVEETEETSAKPKPHESDEEPTIEKYLEKYGSEIKMLGRQAVPSKQITSPDINMTPVQTAAKPVNEQVSQRELEVIERIEKEIISSNLDAAESDKNLNKTETKVIEKTIPIENEASRKEESTKRENVEPRSFDMPISLPDRLHLSHLDVDHLNVTSLKASQILVSDLSGQNLQVTELTSRGGNLVVSGMEFPPSFIQSLASEITAKVEEKAAQKPQKVTAEMVQHIKVEKAAEERSPSRSDSPHQPQKLTLVTAPPPIVVQPTAESFKPPSPEVGKLSGSDSLPAPRTTRNRGKKSMETRIVDDSEDELATTLKASPRGSPRASPSRQIEPLPPTLPPLSASGLTARQLLMELLRIWKSCMTEGFSACVNTVGSMFPEGEKRRDAQTAACVLFIIIIGLFALGFGTDNTVHYHHWDFMPPGM